MFSIRLLYKKNSDMQLDIKKLLNLYSSNNKEEKLSIKNIKTEESFEVYPEFTIDIQSSINLKGFKSYKIEIKFYKDSNEDINPGYRIILEGGKSKYNYTLLARSIYNQCAKIYKNASVNEIENGISINMRYTTEDIVYSLFTDEKMSVTCIGNNIII